MYSTEQAIKNLTQGLHQMTIDEFIAYTAWSLKRGPVYMFGLVLGVPGGYTTSYPIARRVLQTLVNEQLVSIYMVPVDGRGRPRKMYQLDGHSHRINQLAALWETEVMGSVAT